MKDRIVTGIVLSAVLIPLLTITKLLELFQVFMFIFVVIASLEMIRMYETQKKFQLLPKIGIILFVINVFFFVAGFCRICFWRLFLI